MDIKNGKTVKTYENYKHLRSFIPLIDNDNADTNANTNMIKELWEEHLHKRPEDPLEFLYNHKLITNNTVINICEKDDKFKLDCPILSKLLVSDKIKFEDLTYKDALPFKHFFITKDTIITDILHTHNMTVDKITYIESKIANIKKNKLKLSDVVKKQNADLIASLENDIEQLKPFLNIIDPYYKKHILFNTKIGFRLTFQESLNTHCSLLYLRYICNNKDRLNKNFLSPRDK